MSNELYILAFVNAIYGKFKYLTMRRFFKLFLLLFTINSFSQSLTSGTYYNGVMETYPIEKETRNILWDSPLKFSSQLVKFKIHENQDIQLVVLSRSNEEVELYLTYQGIDKKGFMKYEIRDYVYYLVYEKNNYLLFASEKDNKPISAMVIRDYN